MVLIVWLLLHGAAPIFYASPVLPITAAECDQLAASWLEAQVREAMTDWQRGHWIAQHQCVPVKVCKRSLQTCRWGHDV